jgi:hypothetical protein
VELGDQLIGPGLSGSPRGSLFPGSRSRTTDGGALPEAPVQTKRAFLRYAMLLMASAPALMAAWGLGRFVLFRTGQDRTREISRALLEKIEPDLPFHHPESGAWLLRQKDAPGLIILDDRCTHLGCRYNWEP